MSCLADVRRAVSDAFVSGAEYVCPARVRQSLPSYSDRQVRAALQALAAEGALVSRVVWLAPEQVPYAPTRATDGLPSRLPPVHVDLAEVEKHIGLTAAGTTVGGCAVALDWSRYRVERAIEHGLSTGRLQSTVLHLPTLSRPTTFYRLTKRTTK